MWMHKLDALELKLIADDTCLDLRCAMIQGICSLKNREPHPQSTSSICMDVTLVIQHQSKIGSNN